MCKKQKISLIGIGMGSRKSMTIEAAEAVRNCGCMIGARRMLSAAGAGRYAAGSYRKTARETQDRRSSRDIRRSPGSGQTRAVPELCEYNAEKIFAYTEAHPEYSRVAVVLSGDTGFYSGAKKLIRDCLQSAPGRYEVEMIPGISSVVCLAARLKTTWEDGKH